jgi:GNAT superfamily N-acetyltransferase
VWVTQSLPAGRIIISIIAIEKFPITETDTGWSLFQKSSETAVHMFKAWFHKIIAGNYTATPQDHTKAKLYMRKDFQEAKDLSRFVRAFYWPGKDSAFYRNEKGEIITLSYGEKEKEHILPNTEDERAYSFEEFEEKYLAPYKDLDYVFWPEKGFIVWRMSTGENAELLHVRTFVRGKGYSRELVGAMIQGLHEKRPPYFSVFGFALASRVDLKTVYPRLGFEISEDIPGPYKGGPSFMFYQSFEKLKKIYGIE